MRFAATTARVGAASLGSVIDVQGSSRLQSLPHVQVNRNNTVLACAICERTLLLGERAAGYVAAGRRVTVCELCLDEADQRGWRRAGAPAPPPMAAAVDRGPGLL